MYLTGVKKEDKWLLSTWETTSGMSWERVCRAACAAYEEIDALQSDGSKRSGADVFTGVIAGAELDKAFVQSKEDIMQLPEEGTLTVRGISKYFEVPMQLLFYNQTNIIRLDIYEDINRVFSPGDFENYVHFNRLFGKFMSYVELRALIGDKVLNPYSQSAK